MVLWKDASSQKNLLPVQNNIKHTCEKIIFVSICSINSHRTCPNYFLGWVGVKGKIWKIRSILTRISEHYYSNKILMISVPYNWKCSVIKGHFLLHFKLQVVGHFWVGASYPTEYSAEVTDSITIGGGEGQCSAPRISLRKKQTKTMQITITIATEISKIKIQSQISFS